MDITGKTFLIVGGGAVAKEKLESISRFGEKIIIVARETDIHESENVRVIKKDFEPSDIDMADFVIGATSDRGLNALIAKSCDDKNIPVNIVDDKELCSFVMPSMVKRGSLTVAISTNGKSPAYAMQLRKSIESQIPEEIDDILIRMESLRAVIPDRIQEPAARKKFYKILLARLIETNNSLDDEEIEKMVRNYEK